METESMETESKKKILLVDDDDGIQMFYGEELEDEGYQVIPALNGKQALEKFEDDPPDLVILDINMPDMTGLEVLRQMKNINADLPVILSSAYPDYKQDLSSWASEEYVVKSANMDELKAAVLRNLG